MHNPTHDAEISFQPVSRRCLQNGSEMSRSLFFQRLQNGRFFKKFSTNKIYYRRNFLPKKVSWKNLIPHPLSELRSPRVVHHVYFAEKSKIWGFSYPFWQNERGRWNWITQPKICSFLPSSLNSAQKYIYKTLFYM